MKLFVASLSFQATDEDLRELFSQHGEVVDATVVMDRATGRSKGFGFVKMASNEEAQAAMAKLDGAMLRGRPIVVKPAREDERRRTA